MGKFDVVLYGATGFTGSRAAHYIARRAPAGLRWAVAGRSPVALEAIAADTGADGVVCADSSDPSSVAAMVSRARVVMTTVGPFARFGTPVVAACVEHGVDYVDITGETPWVCGLIDRYHERAAADGTKIVPFCGFDSVPADLGTLMMVRHLRERGSSVRRVVAAYRIRGGLNGGTLATLLDAAETGADRAMADVFLLNPRGYRGADAPAESADARGLHRNRTRDAWLVPFVMAPINTRVVRRSNGLEAEYGEPYGPAFVYGERQETRRLGKALGILAGTEVVGRAAHYRGGRALLSRFGPAPGEGPSEEAMDRGLVSVRFEAEGDDGRTAVGRWTFHGDPGNRFTVMSACESALALACQRDELPGGAARGGVLTPATALGTVLLERMGEAGLETSID